MNSIAIKAISKQSALGKNKQEQAHEYFKKLIRRRDAEMNNSREDLTKVSISAAALNALSKWEERNQKVQI